MTFALRRSVPVPSLGVTAHCFEHPCGMVHWHLASADRHRACLISVRTPPDDDTGKPHILEHTVLCGSRRYPVRDPFFAMLRRSLQTFMNAFTYPDHTVYPFSTQVPKDFAHLLSVYADCVFAPTISALDFSQEGHRIDSDGNGGWQRAGVVFNEMKGAYDEPSERVSTAVAAALFPDTCARFNYGGDPTAIPQLTHADLRAAHARWYCPANAVVVSCGDHAADDIHAALAPYLSTPGKPIAVPGLQPPRAPSSITVAVPPGDDPTDACQMGCTWVFGDAADLDRMLDGEMLERVLLGHAGAPLRRMLEGSGLGRSIGSSGLSAPHRHALFSIELSGIDNAAAVRALITDALQRMLHADITRADIDAALHQVELSRREIGGDQFPWPLELALRVVTPWTYGVDPLPFLDQSAAIAALRARATTPGYIARLVQSLLDNPHHVWAESRCDATLVEREEAQRRADVARDVASSDATALLAADAALKTHQQRRDDPEVLPSLTRADIPATRTWATGNTTHGVWCSPAAANGLIHHLAIWTPQPPNDADLDLLPMCAQTVGQLGVGTRDYAQQAQHLTATCGGLGGWMEWSGGRDGVPRLRLGVEVKGLSSRSAVVCSLLSETVRGLRHDEHERLGELLDQNLQRMQERVSGAGSRMAALAAMRGLGGVRSRQHRLAGLGRLAWLRQAADGDVAALAQRLHAVWQQLTAHAPILATIGSGADDDALAQRLAAHWNAPTSAPIAESIPQPLAMAPTAFTTSGQVGHAAMAFVAPPFTHPDAAALAVGCTLMKQQRLHAAIRERGGAYGAGAGYDSGSGTVTITSYRDPRLAATLDDMRAAITWLHNADADQRAIDEAVLSVISDLDTPASPVGEARARFLSDTRGTSVADLNQWRAAIVAMDVERIRHAARTWLSIDKAGVAAVCPESFLSRDGLDWQRIAV